jgi:phosphoribosylformylglycinamidine cyclo-ligase
VLSFLQERGGMSAREAYGTFNMGAGFALYVARADVAATIAAAAAVGLAAWHAGDVEAGAKGLVIEPLELEYAASDLHLRG